MTCKQYTFFDFCPVVLLTIVIFFYNDQGNGFHLFIGCKTLSAIIAKSSSANRIIVIRRTRINHSCIFTAAIRTFHRISPPASNPNLEIYDYFYNTQFSGFLSICKFLSFPYQKIRKIIKLPILYRESYHFADKVILLSSHFKKPFLEYSHLKDDSKIRIIHNALSFHSFYDLANYNHKKKEVLIVSRLEEEPKRISLALKIWKEIETDHTLSEWKLKIVGHGKMESWYKSLVIHYGLQRVFFEGTKNPEPYYNEASIFMMTSSFEGWGLTLTEAQQYGCVPLAFHSFASLTDIITDKVNGFAIPNDDISLYIKQMKLLMTDEKLRKSMSANAIESSKQFSIEIIIKKWMEVINE